VNGDLVPAVAGSIPRTLARARGAAPDIEVMVPRDLLNQRIRTQRTFNVVVGSVAVLSLLVGGIGIMNIMLTSVLERTREIGLRRVVGATERDIVLQFLTESLIVTMAGGAIGIFAGVATSYAITAYAGWSTSVSFMAVVLAFGVSAIVGLGFGIYPALQAAKLQPVDAVRYE
jgi:putative ABC transport system permease protein